MPITVPAEASQVTHGPSGIVTTETQQGINAGNLSNGGNSNSALGYSNTYGSDEWQSGLNASSGLSQYLDAMFSIADYNSARSAYEAQNLRNWQSAQNRIAMEFNAAEAAKNRDWQEYMSNTAHQREVADLMAAGLNPVLSAGGGNGAAVTSGATASGVTSSGAKGDVDMSATSGLVGLLSSLLQAQMQINVANINAQNNMAIADKNNATSEVIAQLNNATQRYGIDKNSETAKYGYDVGAAASMYGANASAGAVLGAANINADTAKWLNQYGNATSMPQFVSQALTGFFGSSIGSITSEASSFISSLIDILFSRKRVYGSAGRSLK